MKSHEKVSLNVLQNVYRDYCRLCGAKEDARDLEKLRSRIEHEGYTFLSITLPTFGDALQRCLEVGHIETESFRGFKKRLGVPLLFGVFLSRIFDSSGTLLLEPDPLAIGALRQLAFTFKKQKEKCDDLKTETALKKFKKVEQELSAVEFTEGDNDDYHRLCHILWSGCVPIHNVWQSIPNHGPGATADRLTGNRKYTAKSWPIRAEGYFPLTSFMLPSLNALDSDYYEGIQQISQKDELPVRVIAVPKTAKTPRIIAIEPTCMQYMQQALAHKLMSALENYHLTKGHINFESQKVNQTLAVQASIDRANATLDLSDASDRVHNALVAPLFDHVPDFYGAVQACRSIRANVANEIIPLVKFASMGSALCFPITSMVYYTLSVLGVLRSRKVQLDYKNVVDACKSTYVYGDDIIVPSDTAPVVCVTLEAFGLRVNKAKSFWKGYFRESCGSDAYAGVNVTPIYLRRMITTDKEDSSMLASLIATSNLFYKAGLWLTATTIKEIVERLIGKLPVVGDECGGLGWQSFTFQPPNTTQQDRHLMSSYKRARWNKKYQYVEYLTYCVKSSMKKDLIDGYPALMRFFLDPNPPILWCGLDCGTNHKPRRDMTQSSRFDTVTLKRRWTRPY